MIAIILSSNNISVSLLFFVFCFTFGTCSTCETIIKKDFCLFCVIPAKKTQFAFVFIYIYIYICIYIYIYVYIYIYIYLYIHEI